jgi:23S rRNA (pseudouridine1915-N3)-methyltransferase
MRVSICAVGRLRGGPEADLIADWSSRFDRTGRAVGLGPLEIVEIDDRRGGGVSAQAALLRRAMTDGAIVCSLDERGRQFTSPQFADTLAKWRDVGVGQAAFVIGGADGLDRSLRDESDAVLSFGHMVWPHMLARVMLAEQLYRAATILAGTPYHRH